MTPRSFSERATRVNSSSERSGFRRARRPWIRANLVDRELALERLEHSPIQIAQLHDVRVDHDARLVGFAPWLDALAPHVPDAEREQALRGHDAIVLRADPLAQQLAMRRHGEALRHLERRP